LQRVGRGPNQIISDFYCVRLVAPQGSRPLACGKQSITLQAANFAVHDVTSFDRDQLCILPRNLGSGRGLALIGSWLKRNRVAKNGNVLGSSNESDAYDPNSQYKISKTKLSISMMAATPATESTKASLASW
jgi:hypothetical protein